MAERAAGGFVTRAFESMLKECSNMKHNDLQSAIQVYLEGGVETVKKGMIGKINKKLPDGHGN